jgi:hypothetical protein
MNEMLNDWANTKTYATRENLMRALADAGLETSKGMLVVRTPEGRWTAVFAKSFHENFMYVVHQGFKVLG